MNDVPLYTERAVLNPSDGLRIQAWVLARVNEGKAMAQAEAADLRYLQALCGGGPVRMRLYPGVAPLTREA